MLGKHQVVIAAVAALASPFAFAANFANASAGYISAQITDSNGSCNGTCTFVPVDANVAFDFRGQKASAHSGAANFQLTASASTAFSVAPYDKMRASATASFTDILTVDDVNHHGENALIFFKYSLAGSATAVQNNGYDTSANIAMWMGFGDGSVTKNGWAGPGYTGGFLATPSTTDYYAIFFTKLGSSSGLNINLNSSCDSVSTLGGASCSVSSNFTFKGVEAVALLDGTELNHFSVTSFSGLNYTNAAPVPEPASWALMLCGMGLFTVWTRRKGQAH